MKAKNIFMKIPPNLPMRGGVLSSPHSGGVRGGFLSYPKSDVEKTKSDVEKTKSDVEKTKSDVEKLSWEVGKSVSHSGKSGSHVEKKSFSDGEFRHRFQAADTNIGEMTFKKTKRKSEKLQTMFYALEFLPDFFPFGIFLTSGEQSAAGVEGGLSILNLCAAKGDIEPASIVAKNTAVAGIVFAPVALYGGDEPERRSLWSAACGGSGVQGCKEGCRLDAGEG